MVLNGYFYFNVCKNVLFVEWLHILWFWLSSVVLRCSCSDRSKIINCGEKLVNCFFQIIRFILEIDITVLVACFVGFLMHPTVAFKKLLVFRCRINV